MKQCHKAYESPMGKMYFNRNHAAQLMQVMQASGIEISGFEYDKGQGSNTTNDVPGEIHYKGQGISIDVLTKGLKSAEIMVKTNNPKYEGNAQAIMDAIGGYVIHGPDHPTDKKEKMKNSVGIIKDYKPNVNETEDAAEKK